MGNWQEVAKEYFPDAGIQTPAELYITAGTQLARRALHVEVSIAPQTYTDIAILDDPNSVQNAVIKASKNVKGEVIDTVGYRLGYEAMIEDARNNGDAALSRLLHDPRQDYEPTTFQQTWASFFNQQISPKVQINRA